MKMRIIAISCIALLAASCGQGPDGSAALRTADHSVDEYKSNSELRTQTIDACKAKDEAQFKEYQALAGCKNATAASRDLSDSALDDAVRAENARERAARQGK